MFILNCTPTLRMQHPNRDDIPRDGRIFHALSYDSNGYAFVYNEYVCGYYDVPYELRDGFGVGAKKLQATNPSLYWKKVKRIMDDIDAYWEKQDSCNQLKKTAKEQMPSYPGGMGALMQYLSNNIKYPEIAEKNGIQGRVVCTFVVETDGSIKNVEVSKSVSPELDAESVRVIRTMHHWIPGKIDGKPVPMEYTLPITFRMY